MTVATAYEMEEIGINGELEAVNAWHFCSKECCEEWSKDSDRRIMVGSDSESELIDGEVCNNCSKPF